MDSDTTSPVLRKAKLTIHNLEHAEDASQLLYLMTPDENNESRNFRNTKVSKAYDMHHIQDTILAACKHPKSMSFMIRDIYYFKKHLQKSPLAPKTLGELETCAFLALRDEATESPKKYWRSNPDVTGVVTRYVDPNSFSAGFYSLFSKAGIPFKYFEIEELEIRDPEKLRKNVEDHLTHDSGLSVNDVLDIKKNFDPRKLPKRIYHVYYSRWVDGDLPTDGPKTLYALRCIMDELNTNMEIVHCRAGVGRTATTICYLICTRQFIDYNNKEVLGVALSNAVKKVQDSRPLSMRNFCQFKYLEHALKNYMRVMTTNIKERHWLLCMEFNAQVVGTVIGTKDVFHYRTSKIFDNTYIDDKTVLAISRQNKDGYVIDQDITKTVSDHVKAKGKNRKDPHYMEGQLEKHQKLISPNARNVQHIKEGSCYIITKDEVYNFIWGEGSNVYKFLETTVLREEITQTVSE